MNDVDGEYYLRRCGEDSLQRRHSSDHLHQRARALAALDVVPPPAALQIVSDYEQARDLRGLFDDDRHFEDNLADDWTPPTIRSCGQTLQIEWGTITLHYLTIGADESSIAVTMKANPPPPSKKRGFPRRYRDHEEAPDLDIADDKGNTLSSGFSGGGNSQQWEGSYSVHPSLDPAAAYLTVMGQRVELGPSPDDVIVRVTHVDPARPAAERAARYLRRSLAAPTHHHFGKSTVPVAAETFLACGILTPDADVLVDVAEAQRVSDQAVPAISYGATHPRGGSRAARGRPRLADRTVGVAVSLPGGVHLAVTDLRSESDGVTVGFHAAVTSADALVRSLAECFAMTATDDTGAEYQGELDGWGSGGGTFTGRIKFPTPLTASTLTLHLATDRADVTVAIPLRWESTQ